VRDRALGAELGVELVELLLVRKRAVPEEVGDLLERGVLREVLDVVAAVEELAGLAVDVRELGVEGGDAFEASGLHGGLGGGRSSRGRVSHRGGKNGYERIESATGRRGRATCGRSPCSARFQRKVNIRAARPESGELSLKRLVGRDAQPPWQGALELRTFGRASQTWPVVR